MKYTLINCQKRLAMLWYIWTPLLLLFLIIQISGGFYGKGPAPIFQTFGWFFTNTLPVLFLIITIGAFAIKKQENGNKKNETPDNVDKFWFKMTFWISVFYLSILSMTPILPAIAFHDMSPHQVMLSFNVINGPLQGLASASLGIYFLKSSDSDKTN